MKYCRTVLGLIHERSKNTVLIVHIHMTGGYSKPLLRKNYFWFDPRIFIPILRSANILHLGIYQYPKTKAVSFTKAIRGLSCSGKRSKSNINRYRFDDDDLCPHGGGYYLHYDKINFLQCGDHYGCYEIPCPSGTLWN